MSDAPQDTSSVQEQQSQAETAEQANPVVEGEQQVQPPKRGGVQDRIDELTREKYEIRREMEAKMLAMQEQLAASQAQAARMLEMVAMQNRQPAPDPLADVAPEDRQRLDAYRRVTIDPEVQALRNELLTVKQTIEQQAYQTAVAQEHPDVQKRAGELLATWRRNGLQGWTMKDAIVYAKGELGSQNAAAAVSARNERGQFAASAQNVIPSQSAPPSPAPARKGGIPANIDQLPLEKQLEIYERELGDKPF